MKKSILQIIFGSVLSGSEIKNVQKNAHTVARLKDGLGIAKSKVTVLTAEKTRGKVKTVQEKSFLDKVIKRARQAVRHKLSLNEEERTKRN